MEQNRLAVPAGNRWLRILGCSAALLAALGCASFFAHTARADVPAPPPATPPVTAAPPGASGTATDAAEPSDTTAAAVPAPDRTSANAADGSQTATDSADTYGTPFGATDPSTGATDPAGTSTDTNASATTDAPDTPPDATGCTGATDPAGTTTDTNATATTDAPDTPPDATGCTGATDPAGTTTDTNATATTDAPDTPPDATGCTGATDPAGTSTDPAGTSTDTDATPTTDAPDTPPDAAGCTGATDPAGTSTDTNATATTDAPDTPPDAVGCTGAADTTSAPAGAVPAAGSGDSTAQASASHEPCAPRRKGSHAVSGKTDSEPPPTEPALADAGPDKPGDSGTVSGPVGGSGRLLLDGELRKAGGSEPSDDRFSAGRVPLDGSTADSGLGGRTGSGVGTTGGGAMLVPASPLTLTADLAGMIRPPVDHRVLTCVYAVSAGVRFDSERILLARLPTRVDTTQAARSGKTTGEKHGYRDGSRKPGSPVPLLPPTTTRLPCRLPPLPCRGPAALEGCRAMASKASSRPASVSSRRVIDASSPSSSNGGERCASSSSSSAPAKARRAVVAACARRPSAPRCADRTRGRKECCKMRVEPAHQELSRPVDRVANDEDSGLELEDSLSLYFRGVGRAPLLTREQERELFRRKEAGDDRAKRLLIEANLRLVIWIARRYRHHDVPVLDLIQEGNLALTRAVERFDYRLGFRLSTYATLLIRHAIEHAADRHVRVVAVPIHVRRQIRAVRRSQQILRERLNREPLLSEIAAEAGVDRRRVAELIDYEQKPISLETPMGEEQSAQSELLEDDTKSAYPEATMAERVQREEVQSALNSLDDRLRLVLQLRFGLAGQPPAVARHGRKGIGRDGRAGSSTGGEGARQTAQPCAGSP